MRGEDMDATEVGKRIKMFREKAGIKQNALATAAGVPPTYIYQVERGRRILGSHLLGFGNYSRRIFPRRKGRQRNIR